MVFDDYVTSDDLFNRNSFITQCIMFVDYFCLFYGFDNACSDRSFFNSKVIPDIDIICMFVGFQILLLLHAMGHGNDFINGTLASDYEHVPAHKVVHTACSPFFAILSRMLFNYWTGKGGHEVSNSEQKICSSAQINHCIGRPQEPTAIQQGGCAHGDIFSVVLP